ncbi:hypothetical protein [Ohessyouella blattaphilus]|uniref:Uncharacterized protein n=1 Tax=Ohessyouella blattaphilus TaxID=2949333 RepID=A0ABT1EJM8_9FIRM|nr:hypothetical protein [Ohessyouella blattaphilus]MCP1110900.1 hypothetical protein [Ohessyouella blattaphilus]MCR8564294.1 hypothetical protein [Ohessyouella blattaphilus]
MGKNEKKLDQDALELSKWVRDRSKKIKQSDVKTELTVTTNKKVKEEPVLYSVLTKNTDKIKKFDTETKSRYKKILESDEYKKASFVAGATAPLAMTLGSSGMGLGALAATSLGAPALFAGGIGVMPLLGPLGIGLLGAPAAIKLFKKLKNGKDKTKGETLGYAEETINNCKDFINKCTDKLKKNAEETAALFGVDLAESLEKMKKTGKKIKINIDDFANKDTNKRIMQYQQICLNQYNRQAELEGLMDRMVTRYNELLNENETLIKNLGEAEELMELANVSMAIVSKGE